MEWFQIFTDPADAPPRSLEQLSKQIMTQMYVDNICGLPVVLTSIINIIVFCSSKDFMKRFSMFLALSIADLLNGIAYMLSANSNLYFLLTNNLFHPVYSNSCFFNTPFGVIRFFASQLPAYLHVAIALERLTAVLFMTWYKTYWSFKYDLLLVTVPFILPLVFFSVVVFFNQHRVLPHRMCSVYNSIGPIIGTIHYSMAALLYFISFIILIWIYRRVNKHKIPTKEEKRKQKVIMAITAISVIFVSFPCLIQILEQWRIPNFKDVFVVGTYSLFCIHSAFGFPVYMVFRPEFRRRFLAIFCCQKEDEQKDSVFFTTGNQHHISSGTNSVIFIKRTANRKETT